MKAPYIGVTGFMSVEEVEKVLEVVPLGTKRKLMVGVLVSSKTLNGIPNKWINRYPHIEKIAEIFPNNSQTLNLVHFHTTDSENFFDQLSEITELGGKNFHGFQLNIKWPKLSILKEYKKQYPDKILVLQCGRGALEAVGCNPKKLTEAICVYEGICKYFLIDASGGQGKVFDSQKVFEYFQYLNTTIREMNFGVAGGLSFETLNLLKPIVEVFPNVSIDAEGGLRDKNDQLDIKKAKDYVSQAYTLFNH